MLLNNLRSKLLKQIQNEIKVYSKFAMNEIKPANKSLYRPSISMSRHELLTNFAILETLREEIVMHPPILQVFGFKMTPYNLLKLILTWFLGKGLDLLYRK